MSIVVIGYASLDYAVRLDSAPQPDRTATILSRSAEWPHLGGSPAYVAAALVAAGAPDAAPVSWVGADAEGAIYRNRLQALGVRTDGISTGRGGARPMPRRAWYIGCSVDEVGEAAILVGDRARVDRIALHLEQPVFLPENRGLRTVTGLRAGFRVTASAFGMGGPVAAIVLHELFDLGVRRFLRIGTAMVMPPAAVGDFVVADGAFRGEGTSGTYAPLGFPAIADFDLGVALRASLERRGGRWRAGLFGTYDGFYTEMFALGSGDRGMIEATRDEIRRLGLIATDMETAPILTAGRMLGARAASLCIGTVDGLTQVKIDSSELATRERELFEIALDAIVAPLPPDERSRA